MINPAQRVLLRHGAKSLKFYHISAATLDKLDRNSQLATHPISLWLRRNQTLSRPRSRWRRRCRHAVRLLEILQEPDVALEGLLAKCQVTAVG
jgi:hypothetical protein